jgi:predicted subunit of tRNA(5-methylaminomethyl-2-thiouridylate) methyltransferase
VKGREKNMRIVEVSITDKYADRVAFLGSIPWRQITDRERVEYDACVTTLGQQVVNKLMKSEWRDEHNG